MCSFGKVVIQLVEPEQRSDVLLRLERCRRPLANQMKVPSLVVNHDSEKEILCVFGNTRYFRTLVNNNGYSY